jgi:hypothetical protein
MRSAGARTVRGVSRDVRRRSYVVRSWSENPARAFHHRQAGGEDYRAWRDHDRRRDHYGWRDHYRRGDHDPRRRDSNNDLRGGGHHQGSAKNTQTKPDSKAGGLHSSDYAAGYHSAWSAADWTTTAGASAGMPTGMRLSDGHSGRQG